MKKFIPCESFPSVSNPGGDDSMDFTKNYKVLIQSMLERVQKTGVNIGTL